MKPSALRMATLGLTAFALAGCASLPGYEYHPLTGTAWRLTAVETSGTSTRLNPDLQSRHTLEFQDRGRLVLRLDCNRGTASWNASMPDTYNNTLTISPIASTKALCPPPTFGGNLETDLSRSSNYTLTPGARTLMISANGILYRDDRN